MLDFKEPKITDKPWVDQCLSHAHSMNCEYTFGNIFVWRTAYVTRICHYKDFLLIRYGRGADIAYSPRWAPAILPMRCGCYSRTRQKMASLYACWV